MTATANVVTLSYQDLIDFDPSHPDQKLVDQIGDAFGSEDSCLGILAVEGIPGWQGFREKLLPLAAKIPLDPDLYEYILPGTMYATGWSHGKEELIPGK